jgi:hypothetical protein
MDRAPVPARQRKAADSKADVLDSEEVPETCAVAVASRSAMDLRRRMCNPGRTSFALPRKHAMPGISVAKAALEKRCRMSAWLRRSRGCRTLKPARGWFLGDRQQCNLAAMRRTCICERRGVA